MKRGVLVYCLMALCLLGVGKANAGNDLVVRGVIRIGFSELPPMRMGNEPGEERGVETEFLRELCRRMNLEPEFVHAPFIRNLKSMEDGRIDLMIGVLRRPERESYMHYLQPAYSSGARYVFCVRAGMENMLQRYGDLQGKIVGVSNGARYFPRFDEDTTLNKYAVLSIRQNIEKLMKNRVDAFIGEETAVRFYLKRERVEESIRFAQYRFEQPQDAFITLSKHSQHAHRLGEFSRHLAMMRKEGVLAELFQDFWGQLQEDGNAL
ncbi:transporter substrate-binding domain-containing protein [Desulfovibrio mangrovi]|uniref:substrate-binding periplasmic protein n=1 Tax=Desulfovibrio mangrovi TaxID=2976983 RepID=UPI002245A805|nr:transporter substrate-binding domain-containing protein [Desulfovibrio mangrovi]UZP67820.1 transporter substrate-binding domain-containing protein [Desulfovibrio mangrovi]